MVHYYVYYVKILFSLNELVHIRKRLHRIGLPRELWCDAFFFISRSHAASFYFSLALSLCVQIM